MRQETKDQKRYRIGLYKYAIGLGAALILVYTLYFAAVDRWLEPTALVVLLIGIAAVQFGLQMVVFLHALDEKRPRWTLWSILFSFVMMLIIVVASLWIMQNMNYNMHMSPEQMTEFMIEQNKKGF